MKEALDLCREAAKTDTSALPAIAAATALLAGKPSAEDFALAEPLLSKAAADHKDDARLLTALASVRVVQQRLDEATGLFRQRGAKPDDVFALNNLATLLAESPENRKDAATHRPSDRDCRTATELVGHQRNDPGVREQTVGRRASVGTGGRLSACRPEVSFPLGGGLRSCRPPREGPRRFPHGPRIVWPARY